MSQAAVCLRSSARQRQPHLGMDAPWLPRRIFFISSCPLHLRRCPVRSVFCRSLVPIVLKYPFFVPSLSFGRRISPTSGALFILLICCFARRQNFPKSPALRKLIANVFIRKRFKRSIHFYFASLKHVPLKMLIGKKAKHLSISYLYPAIYASLPIKGKICIHPLLLHVSPPVARLAS